MKHLHPAATHHLPGFVTGPGEADWLFGVATFTVVATVFAFGLIFLWLHSLPERMAHKAHKVQFELVAALGLLSLFTHVHAFWVAALVLALVKLPDFQVPDVVGPLERIADAVGRRPSSPAAVAAPGAAPPAAEVGLAAGAGHMPSKAVSEKDA